MKTWLAAVIGLVTVGTLGLAPRCWADAPDANEAAVNRAVDARLHEVLAGLLRTERKAHLNSPRPELAQIRVARSTTR